MTAEKPKTAHNGWYARLFEPRIDFYALLNRQAATTVAGMSALEEWINKGANERCQLVRDLEKEADDQRLDLERKLVDAFITPFDREDIYDVSAKLDEVINSAKAAVREIEALSLPPTVEVVQEMAQTLVEGTRCLAQSIQHLAGSLSEAAEQATLARKSENRFARIYRLAMHELYNSDDVKTILKTREVYKAMQVGSERIDALGEKLLHVIVKIS
jgi:uncharacterized protein Yka (UPF0111/DUF47 family)